MISYIVTMYKYGQRDNHSYVLGAWETFEKAQAIGDQEMIERGPGLSPNNHKYEYEIVKFDTDEYLLQKLINPEPEYRPDYLGETMAAIPSETTYT